MKDEKLGNEPRAQEPQHTDRREDLKILLQMLAPETLDMENYQEEFEQEDLVMSFNFNNMPLDIEERHISAIYTMNSNRTEDDNRGQM